LGNPVDGFFFKRSVSKVTLHVNPTFTSVVYGLRTFLLEGLGDSLSLLSRSSLDVFALRDSEGYFKSRLFKVSSSPTLNQLIKPVDYLVHVLNPF
jgi:hypothetical protein